MAEAEDLIIDGVRHATVALGRFWRRHRPQLQEPAVFLRDARLRLELLIEAVLGRQWPIRVAQPLAAPSFARRLFARDSVSSASTSALPGNDGTAIYLPPSLPAALLPGPAGGADAYCLLALLQAVRCERGSALYAEAASRGLAADLYLLAEGVAADRNMQLLLPGWRPALARLYLGILQDLARRRPGGGLEKEVAALYGQFLGGSQDGPPFQSTPAASLDWAESRARDLQSRYPRERYPPWLGDVVVGRLLAPEALPCRSGGASFSGQLPPPPSKAESPRNAALSRRPRVRKPEDGEDDPSPGIWMVQSSDPHPHAEDPLGLNRPEDREPEDDLQGAAESLAEMEQARLVHTPGRSRETFHGSDPPPRLEGSRTGDGEKGGFRYPEWDYQASRHLEQAVRVHCTPAPEGPADWVDKAMARNAGMLREIRRRLGAIRPGHQILKGQPEGDEVDWDALVAERSEHRAGLSTSGAFYRDRRPAPRRLGLLLLVDASASTDAWVTSNVRVIDVEKEAALIAACALQSFQAEFAVMAFSGEGPLGVQVLEIKAFDEAWSQGPQRRLAGLEPDRYTRLGAALRHGSRLLASRMVDHRLLLLLSDGRPNDCDRYASRYGIEDARQALAEARLQHITPYCFTVDREGSSYLPTLFGAGSYTIVQRPQQLPTAFIDWLRKAAQRCTG